MYKILFVVVGGYLLYFFALVNVYAADKVSAVHTVVPLRFAEVAQYYSEGQSISQGNMDQEDRVFSGFSQSYAAVGSIGLVGGVSYALRGGAWLHSLGRSVWWTGFPVITALLGGAIYACFARLLSIEDTSMLLASNASHLPSEIVSSSEKQRIDEDIYRYLNHSNPPPVKIPFLVKDYDDWYREMEEELYHIEDHSAENAFADVMVSVLQKLEHREMQISYLMQRYRERKQEESSSGRYSLYQDRLEKLEKLFLTYVTMVDNLRLSSESLQEYEEHGIAGLNAMVMTSYLMLQNMYVALADREYIYPTLEKKHLILGLAFIPSNRAFHTAETMKALSTKYSISVVDSIQNTVAKELEEYSGLTIQNWNDIASSEIPDLTKNSEDIFERLSYVVSREDDDVISEKSPPYYQDYIDFHKKMIIKFYSHVFVPFPFDDDHIPVQEKYRIVKTLHHTLSVLVDDLLSLPNIILETLILLRADPPKDV